MNKSNIVLIGMPGSGKSTVGVVLAKEAILDFVDTDVLIQNREQCSLQSIVDTQGHEVLKQIEEEVIVETIFENQVVATGGSAAYSPRSMAHLKQNSTLVFLNVSLENLKLRIKNFTTRGIAKGPNQSFEELFDERYTLYSKYADVVIECDGTTVEEVVEKILESNER
ncbi:shikimate kinase [Fibrobacterales bacterium]|nr:shikimate kinase [Fibrobacterales bacterium]